MDVPKRLYVIHDGPPGPLLEAATKVELPHEILKVQCNSNRESLMATFDLANGIVRQSHSVSGVVYFLEDDYLHQSRAIRVIYSGAQQFGIVTGYDHNDRYTREDDITINRETISFCKSTNCHWRTAESTTCTWACTFDMWTTISQEAYSFLLNDRGFFRRLLREYGIRLWTPIPGCTSHIMEGLMSPGVDWESASKLYRFA